MRPSYSAAVRVRAAVAALLVAVVAPAAASASLPTSLDRALRVPHVSLARTGAVAIDLSTGETIYARNGALPLLPASNEKLTVTYAALTALGPGFTIETDALGEGQQVGTAWQGDLVLKGYGDPTLSSADLAVLAREVRSSGITTISGRILGDESWFDAHRTAPGWKAAFYINESPPLSALIVDRGRVGRTTSRDPALAAAQLFRAALVRAGIHIGGDAAHGTADDAAVQIAETDSPTLAAIVHWMDRVSDNFVAEMLVKELGAVQSSAGTTAAGLGVVAGQLSAAGVPLAGVRLVDGSGLSRLDRLTPNALVSLLSATPRYGSSCSRRCPSRGAPARCTTGCEPGPRRESSTPRPARRTTRRRSPASSPTATSSRCCRTGTRSRGRGRVARRTASRQP
jgi:D-alanyl-D-alanine carboxypeptidase/D-alanyl-D-alanine-endopeptidase (penicillin-binding protein 4)